MVDASNFVTNNQTYLKPSDIDNKAEASKRMAIITAEAQFKEFKSKTDETTYHKLNVPIDYQEKSTVLSLTRVPTTILVNALGPDTKDWIGAILVLTVAGTGKPYINVDVWKKPDEVNTL